MVVQTRWADDSARLWSELELGGDKCLGEEFFFVIPLFLGVLTCFCSRASTASLDLADSVLTVAFPPIH
jgi:hypothetical protein